MSNNLYLLPISDQMISLGCEDLYTPEKLEIHSVKNLHTILIIKVNKIAFYNRFLLELDENPDKYVYKFKEGNNSIYLWIRDSFMHEDDYEVNILIEG